MSIESKKNEFRLRFYNWAIQDVQREESHNFPFLQSFKSGLGRRALNVLLSTKKEKRRHLFGALVKRFWLSTMDGKMTAEEIAATKYFLREVSTPLPGEIELMEMEIREPSRFKLDQKLLLACLKKQLEPIFGSQFVQTDRNVWKATIDIDGWKLFTIVDFGSRLHQIAYHHIFAPSNDYICENQISLLSWMGIGGQTDWSGIQENDVEPTFRDLTKICSHFLKALPVLLDGLK